MQTKIKTGSGTAAILLLYKYIAHESRIQPTRKRKVEFWKLPRYAKHKPVGQLLDQVPFFSYTWIYIGLHLPRISSSPLNFSFLTIHDKAKLRCYFPFIFSIVKWFPLHALLSLCNVNRSKINSVSVFKPSPPALFHFLKNRPILT